MLKEFIEYLQNQTKNPLLVVGGRNYNVRYDNSISPIEEPERKPIMFSSLTSLIEYILLSDSFNIEDIIIHVENSKTVIVRSKVFGTWKQSEDIAIASISYSNFFGNYYQMDEFKIKLLTCFEETPDSKRIISLISKVIDSNIKNIEDDGITQSVTIKNGITMVGEEKLPPIVTLIPYCTFTEVLQPEREFLLRGRKQGDSVQYALFEADGLSWEYNVRQTLKSYLENELHSKKENIVFNVLA